MNILFVCTGNTCRSPLAEAIFNNKYSLGKGCSAGLSIVPNSTVSLNSYFLAKNKLGIDINNRKAIQLDEKMLEEHDLVLTMTKYMRDIIIYNFPHIKNKVFSLLEYINMEGDIIDPYGGDLSIYEETYKQLEVAIKQLVNIIT